MVRALAARAQTYPLPRRIMPARIREAAAEGRRAGHILAAQRARLS